MYLINRAQLLKKLAQCEIHSRQTFKQKRFFTNRFLEEDEYIEGDLEINVKSSESKEKQSKFQENFVRFENLNKTILDDYEYNVRKISNSQMSTQISFDNLKSKFNFDLDTTDDYFKNKPKESISQEK